MKGKKFFYWLGIMDAKLFHVPDRRALREWYEGQTLPTWKKWQKDAYLQGYWQQKLNNK